MDGLISVTEARNNLSELIDQVVEKGKKFILLRKSQPQAVIIPYNELVKEEENWQKEFKRLVLETKPSFKNWLKKQGISQKNLSEDKLYDLIDQAAGRY